MSHYSREIKEAIVAKFCSPGGPTYSQMARESGIALATLHNWVKKFGSADGVTQQKSKRVWTPKEKLQMVFEALSLNETELGEFLRRNGLHSHTIAEWKAEARADTPEARERGRPKLDPEVVALRRETEQLKKNLRRKDKALAEASALIILKKEPRKSGARTRTTSKRYRSS